MRTPGFPVACSRIGRWWYGEDEIDVVGLDEGSDTLLLGACKWTGEAIGPELLVELESIEPQVRWRGSDRSVALSLFAKAGFTPALRASAEDRVDVHLFTVDDVVKLFDVTRQPSDRDRFGKHSDTG